MLREKIVSKLGFGPHFLKFSFWRFTIESLRDRYSEFTVRLGRLQRVQARPALTLGESRILQKTQITLKNF